MGIQLLLFILFLFRVPSIDCSIYRSMQYAGLVAAIVGLVIIIAALVSLNKNISPFPSPRHQAVLITNGVFKFLRHPIYTGILMTISGLGLYTENTLRLLIFLLLLLLFIFKAQYEETLLVNKFPSYADYKKRAGMFLPKFYK
ncbi:hypothetical protein BH11BAC3_BH11BAC3_46160 [soil metagenome]